MEKKKKEPTKNGIYIITIFLAILLLYFMNRYVSKDVTVFEDHYENEMTEAEVTRVLDRQTNSYGMESEYEDTTITFEAEVTKGPMKGQTVQAAQMIEGGYPDGAVVEVADGQEVLLLQMEDGEYSWMYVETVRSNAIVWLAGAFAVGLLIFGRKKGLTTLITLVLTGLVIFTVFVPSILAGMNIYAMAVVVCLYVIVTTLVILNGFNRKTLTAIFGCFSGILAAAAVMGLMDTSLHLTGMISDEAMYLTYLPLDHSIDLKAIIFSGMIIGAMGAVMDVAMSISSSLWEIKRNSRAIAAKGLFASGMAIGRDIMGTMANTLILAYIGSSLSTVLLLIVYDPSLMFLLNREMIIVEILQALVGSFGILFAVPLTALAAALIYTRKKQLPEKPRDSIDT